MGRIASGGMRPGLESLEPDEEAQRIDVQMAVSGSMMQTASPYLGKTNFIITHRDNYIGLTGRSSRKQFLMAL